jgi:hypothetical protein
MTVLSRAIVDVVVDMGSRNVRLCTAIEYSLDVVEDFETSGRVRATLGTQVVDMHHLIELLMPGGWRTEGAKSKGLCVKR